MENLETSRYAISAMVCILSLFGAHARYVFDHGRLDFRPLLGEYVVGLLTGICVYFLIADASAFGKEFKYFCVVMSGFCARDLIEFMSYTFVEKFKRIVNPPEEKK